jgi:hypothetical protein
VSRLRNRSQNAVSNHVKSSWFGAQSSRCWARRCSHSARHGFDPWLNSTQRRTKSRPSTASARWEHAFDAASLQNGQCLWLIIAQVFRAAVVPYPSTRAFSQASNFALTRADGGAGGYAAFPGHAPASMVRWKAMEPFLLRQSICLHPKSTPANKDRLLIRGRAWR